MRQEDPFSGFARRFTNLVDFLLREVLGSYSTLSVIIVFFLEMKISVGAAIFLVDPMRVREVTYVLVVPVW
jgi:hypothetical protein